jgi:hypothetical protein
MCLRIAVCRCGRRCSSPQGAPSAWAVEERAESSPKPSPHFIHSFQRRRSQQFDRGPCRHPLCVVLNHCRHLTMIIDVSVAGNGEVQQHTTSPLHAEG